MKGCTKLAKIFKFSNLEKLLFEYLSSKEQSVTSISKALKVPRTSLYEPLKSLKDRGLIEKVKVGRREHWKKLSETVIEDIFSTNISNTECFRRPEFFFREGKKELLNIYESALERGGRLKGIQPNKSGTTAFEIVSSEDVVNINKKIKSKGIIVESIIQDNFVEFYANFLKKKGLSVEEIFESFGERTADTTYVPSEFFNFNSEILITKSAVFIINWGKLIAIEIRNQEIVGFFKDFFELAKRAGHKVDQNKLVRDYLEKT